MLTSLRCCGVFEGVILGLKVVDSSQQMLSPAPPPFFFLGGGGRKLFSSFLRVSAFSSFYMGRFFPPRRQTLINLQFDALLI